MVPSTKYGGSSAISSVSGISVNNDGKDDDANAESIVNLSIMDDDMTSSGIMYLKLTKTCGLDELYDKINSQSKPDLSPNEIKAGMQ